MAYFVGIDVGTTGVKGLLINEKGEVAGNAFESYSVSMPCAGWAEQNPDSWWKATVSTINKVLTVSRISSREIKGIGLSGQYHGLVLVGKNGNVLRPCILWCDQRTTRECQEIEQKVGREKLFQLTCNRILTAFTATKLLWVRKKEPQIYEMIFRMLLPKDYIRFRLTGEFATEVTDASGTLLLDIKKRCWSNQMCQALQIDRAILPICYESSEITGQVSDETAHITGLEKGTPVVGGAGDQAAQAVGNGIVREGLISSTIGTSGVLFAPSNQVKVDPRGRVNSFCHALPQKWHVMGVMISAGGSLRWFRDNLGEEETRLAKEKGKDVYQVLTEEASSVEPGSEELIFLPYLGGARHPYADPYARGVFFGLTLRHKKAHLIRSVLEGVAYGLRDCLDIIKELGIPVKEVVSSGGGGKSDLWNQIQADVNNLPILRTNVSEGASFGAAILAAVGTGVYDTVEEACREIIRTNKEFYPLKNNVALYTNLYKIYRSLYPILKDTFARLPR